MLIFNNHYLEQRMRGCLVFPGSHFSVIWVNVKQQEALTLCKIHSTANS